MNSVTKGITLKNIIKLILDSSLVLSQTVVSIIETL